MLSTTLRCVPCASNLKTATLVCQYVMRLGIGEWRQSMYRPEAQSGRPNSVVDQKMTMTSLTLAPTLS